MTDTKGFLYALEQGQPLDDLACRKGSGYKATERYKVQTQAVLKMPKADETCNCSLVVEHAGQCRPCHALSPST